MSMIDWSVAQYQVLSVQLVRLVMLMGLASLGYLINDQFKLLLFFSSKAKWSRKKVRVNKIVKII